MTVRRFIAQSPVIIILPSSRYDLNNERNIKTPLSLSLSLSLSPDFYVSLPLSFSLYF